MRYCCNVIFCTRPFILTAPRSMLRFWTPIAHLLSSKMNTFTAGSLSVFDYFELKITDLTANLSLFIEERTPAEKINWFYLTFLWNAWVFVKLWDIFGEQSSIRIVSITKEKVQNANYKHGLYFLASFSKVISRHSRAKVVRSWTSINRFVVRGRELFWTTIPRYL